MLHALRARAICCWRVSCIEQPKHARTIAQNEMRAITIIDGEFRVSIEPPRVQRTVHASNTHTKKINKYPETENRKENRENQSCSTVPRRPTELNGIGRRVDVERKKVEKTKATTMCTTYDFHSFCCPPARSMRALMCGYASCASCDVTTCVLEQQ